MHLFYLTCCWLYMMRQNYCCCYTCYTFIFILPYRYCWLYIVLFTRVVLGVIHVTPLFYLTGIAGYTLCYSLVLFLVLYMLHPYFTLHVLLVIHCVIHSCCSWCYTCYTLILPPGIAGYTLCYSLVLFLVLYMLHTYFTLQVLLVIHCVIHKCCSWCYTCYTLILPYMYCWLYIVLFTRVVLGVIHVTPLFYLTGIAGYTLCYSLVLFLVLYMLHPYFTLQLLLVIHCVIHSCCSWCYTCYTLILPYMYCWLYIVLFTSVVPGVIHVTHLFSLTCIAGYTLCYSLVLFLVLYMLHPYFTLQVLLVIHCGIHSCCSWCYTCYTLILPYRYCWLYIVLFTRVVLGVIHVTPLFYLTGIAGYTLCYSLVLFFVLYMLHPYFTLQVLLVIHCVIHSCRSWCYSCYTLILPYRYCWLYIVLFTRVVLGVIHVTPLFYLTGIAGYTLCYSLVLFLVLYMLHPYFTLHVLLVIHCVIHSCCSWCYTCYTLILPYRYCWLYIVLFTRVVLGVIHVTPLFYLTGIAGYTLCYSLVLFLVLFMLHPFFTLQVLLVIHCVSHSCCSWCYTCYTLILPYRYCWLYIVLFTRVVLGVIHVTPLFYLTGIAGYTLCYSLVLFLVLYMLHPYFTLQVLLVIHCVIHSCCSWCYTSYTLILPYRYCWLYIVLFTSVVLGVIHVTQLFYLTGIAGYTLCYSLVLFLVLYMLHPYFTLHVLLVIHCVIHSCCSWCYTCYTLILPYRYCWLYIVLFTRVVLGVIHVTPLFYLTCIAGYTLCYSLVLFLVLYMLHPYFTLQVLLVIHYVIHSCCSWCYTCYTLILLYRYCWLYIMLFTRVVLGVIHVTPLFYFTGIAGYTLCYSLVLFLVLYMLHLYFTLQVLLVIHCVIHSCCSWCYTCYTLILPYMYCWLYIVLFTRVVLGVIHVTPLFYLTGIAGYTLCYSLVLFLVLYMLHPYFTLHVLLVIHCVIHSCCSWCYTCYTLLLPYRYCWLYIVLFTRVVLGVIHVTPLFYFTCIAGYTLCYSLVLFLVLYMLHTYFYFTLQVLLVIHCVIHSCCSWCYTCYTLILPYMYCL